MTSIKSVTSSTTKYDCTSNGPQNIEDTLHHMTFDCEEDLEYAKSYLELLHAKQTITANSSIKVGMQMHTFKANG